MDLFEKIQALCDKEGITIAQLERKLDFGNGTIRKWGATTPSGDRLAKVADYFKTSIDYLLGRDNETMPERFAIMARKTEDLKEGQKERLYNMLDKTIDNVLAMLDAEEKEKE